MHRTPAYLGGRIAAGLSAVSAVRSAVLIFPLRSVTVRCRPFPQFRSSAVQIAWVGVRARVRGLVPPPMGPSGAAPAAGNSARNRPPAGASWKSPAKGPTSGRIGRQRTPNERTCDLGGTDAAGSATWCKRLVALRSSAAARACKARVATWCCCRRTLRHSVPPISRQCPQSMPPMPPDAGTLHRTPADEFHR